MSKKERVFYTDPFTRGGQIFSHEWRMRLQNFKLVFLLSLPFLFLSFIASFSLYEVGVWDFLDFYCVAYGGSHLKIALWKISKPFLIGLDHRLEGGSGQPWASYHINDFMTTLRFPHGGHWHLRTVMFFHHPWVIKHSALMFKVTLMIGSLWISSLILIYQALKRISLRIETEKIMEGTALVSPQKLEKILKRKNLASDLKLTPTLSWLKGAETQHMIVMGTTGAGKTNCIHGLLQQVAQKKQPVILLDTNCGYVNRYYNEERGDVILNPFDQRSVRWDLWQDCKETPDFDAFAAALIPEPSSVTNPVWHKNAREIIATTAEKLALTGNPTLQALIEHASWKALAQVQSFFKDTPVEALMIAQGRAEETVHSVRMQMTEAMKRLALIPSEGTPFSLQAWVLKGPPGGWLFISCSEKDRATLGPLIRFWVSLAIQGLLRRGEDITYRLWFILDELFSLEGGPVSHLMTLLSEGRKYGGCAVLGLQSLAALEKTYGVGGMKEVMTLCNTKVILRTPEPHTAAYLSQVLGEKEVIETSESLSMGAHHTRDGVNVSSQRRLRPVISRTDIMTLPNLEAYISLGGKCPLTHVTFQLQSVPLKFHQADYQRSFLLLTRLMEERLSQEAKKQNILLKGKSF